MPLFSLVIRRHGQDASSTVSHPSRSADGRADRIVPRMESADGRRSDFDPSEAGWRWHRRREAGALDLVPNKTMSRIITAAKIIVVDNQIEPALKALKKQMLKDGLFQEMKRRVAYDKPSVKRKRKQAAARKKRRKAMRRMERDGE